MAGIGITLWLLIAVAALGALLVCWTLIGEASRTVTAAVADDQDMPRLDGRHREDGNTQRIIPPPPLYPPRY